MKVFVVPSHQQRGSTYFSVIFFALELLLLLLCFFGERVIACGRVL